jgi:hypothetical protein
LQRFYKVRILRKKRSRSFRRSFGQKERAAYNTLPEMFVESLRRRVDDLRDSPQLTGKITFVVAERQADPLLARRLIHDGSVEITNKLNVVDCHGFGREYHKFPEAEGVFNCSKCGVQLCRRCVIGKESVLKRAVRHKAESYKRNSTVSLNNLKASEAHERTGFEGDARNTDAARKASDSEMQRATWSKYYSGCVGKGGVACQLCGWTVTIELCTGAIDDYAYIDKVQIPDTALAGRIREERSDIGKALHKHFRQRISMYSGRTRTRSTAVFATLFCSE